MGTRIPMDDDLALADRAFGIGPKMIRLCLYLGNSP